MKFSLCVSHKFSKIVCKNFFMPKIKSKLSIDELIVCGSLQSFVVRKRKNKFCKTSQNCNLSALLNFTSLYTNMSMSRVHMFFYPFFQKKSLYREKRNSKGRSCYIFFLICLLFVLEGICKIQS